MGAEVLDQKFLAGKSLYLNCCQESLCHPHIQQLNASVVKLLVKQLLPFYLMDSVPFREFVECAFLFT